MSESHPAGWTCIATYATLQQAAIDRGLLQSEGIEAIIPDDIMSGSVYPMTLTWSAVSLYVPEAQADRARQLLSHATDNAGE